MKTCDYCKDAEIDFRCPNCRRLPKDPQLAILSEVHDILNQYNTSYLTIKLSDHEIHQCLKVLTGIVTRLVKDTRQLRAPFGTRKGIPKHAPDCSIHKPPHNHYDCVINRQPRVPRMETINVRNDKYIYHCLNCNTITKDKEGHKCPDVYLQDLYNWKV